MRLFTMFLEIHQDQLKDTIVDAIQNGEEKMLPGLGVLFEVIWKNALTRINKICYKH